MHCFKLMKILMRYGILIPLVSLACVSSAAALPFNDDMVDNPMKTGRIMRPAPKEAVAVGSLSYKLANRDEALKLSNPQSADSFSVANGKRLYDVNCTPCHGDIAANPYKPGTVTKFLPGPNLALGMYHEKPSDPKDGEGRSDGSIYATIHFGSLSTLMPPLGWKLSPAEHWDLVNYIRKVQESAK